MLRTRRLFACFLLPLFAATPAFARDCPKDKPWQCYTEVTFEADNFKLHLIVFGNDEMMGEIERDGRLRRMIFVGEKRPALYAGLTPDEMQHMNPLVFIVPVPHVASFLMTAFPEGPASVPTRAVTFRSGPDKVSVSRDAGGLIHYTLDTVELGKASGSFSVKKMLPLADDYPVGEWQLADGRRLKRLGELRAGVSPVPDPAGPRPHDRPVLVPRVREFTIRAAPMSATGVSVQRRAAVPSDSSNSPSPR